MYLCIYTLYIHIYTIYTYNIYTEYIHTETCACEAKWKKMPLQKLDSQEEGTVKVGYGGTGEGEVGGASKTV